MKNLFYIFDRTSKSQKLKKILLKKNKNSNPKNCDYIIVCGGDGFMLNSLKRYFKFNKPFYGINCGTFGFLMNKYSYKEIEKKIKTARRVQINPLEITANSKKSSRKLIAINEVSLFRQSKQTASLSLKVANKNIIKKLISDGVIIATPAGSTAYNLSVHGPILSLNSGKLAVTPISPFRPRRWKGKIISNKSIIKIKNLDPSKRPVAAVADNIEVRNINSLSIKINTKIKINLLHDKNRTLVKKIQAEQLKKNTQ